MNISENSFYNLWQMSGDWVCNWDESDSYELNGVKWRGYGHICKECGLCMPEPYRECECGSVDWLLLYSPAGYLVVVDVS